MTKKILEKEVEIFSEGIKEASGYPMKVEYYLLESECEQTEDFKLGKVFGIELIKKAPGTNDEIISYRNFSNNFEITKKILNKLADNSVTPVGLPYVLDNIIGL